MRGQALQEFVKQQQDIERSERLAERELENDKIVQVEKDREVESAKIAADREIEMARIESIDRQAEKISFLVSCSRKVYVHLKPKSFKNLEVMA